MAKKIEIDKDLCIGCGNCESVAPDYFKLGDDGKSHVKKQYDQKDDKVIKEAVSGCPVKAIKLS